MDTSNEIEHHKFFPIQWARLAVKHITICLFFFFILSFMGCDNIEPIRNSEAEVNVVYKFVEIEGRKYIASYGGHGYWVLAGPLEEKHE